MMARRRSRRLISTTLSICLTLGSGCGTDLLRLFGDELETAGEGANDFADAVDDLAEDLDDGEDDAFEDFFEALFGG